MTKNVLSIDTHGLVADEKRWPYGERAVEFFPPSLFGGRDESRRRATVKVRRRTRR